LLFVGNNDTSLLMNVALFSIGTHLHWWFPKPLALLNCLEQKQQQNIGIFISRCGCLVVVRSLGDVRCSEV